MKRDNNGLKCLIAATGYSMYGIRACWQNEAAFRQELLLCLVLVPAAIYLGDTISEIAILIASLMFILVVELINSAIEAVVDRFGDEIHPLSGRAKDMGSATVLLSFVVAGLVWIAVLT